MAFLAKNRIFAAAAFVMLGLASFSVHATTDPAARGRGIFVALERKHEQEAQERGVAVVLAFASAPTAPLFLGPLGWTEIGRPRVWARPLPVGGKAAERVERFTPQRVVPQILAAYEDVLRSSRARRGVSPP